MLPGCNGYRICAELRRAGDRTPILMLTAKDGALDETEGLDTGADDYLRKPFSFRVLVSRIHALLRRAALGDPPPLQLGDLRVEPRQRRGARGGHADAPTPPHARAIRRRCSSATCGWSPGNGGCCGATPRSPSPPASSTCSATWCAVPGRSCPSSSCSRASGRTTSRAIRTWSRCTSDGCVARSTSR